MSNPITKESDPLLWTLLNNAFLAEGEPRNVTRGVKLYKPIRTITEEVVFEEVVPMDYIDSRSLKNSRKATYRNLDK